MPLPFFTPHKYKHSLSIIPTKENTRPQYLLCSPRGQVWGWLPAVFNQILFLPCEIFPVGSYCSHTLLLCLFAKMCPIPNLQELNLSLACSQILDITPAQPKTFTLFPITVLISASFVPPNLGHLVFPLSNFPPISSPVLFLSFVTHLFPCPCAPPFQPAQQYLPCSPHLHCTVPSISSCSSCCLIHLQSCEPHTCTVAVMVREEGETADKTKTLVLRANWGEDHTRRSWKDNQPDTPVAITSC